MTAKEKILYPLTLLFFATFYMPSAMHTINGVIIGLLAVYSFFFFNSWKEKWTLLRERKYIIAMVVFFALTVMSLFLSQDQDKGFRFLDKRLVLCYFPISIGLMHLSKELRDKILLGFAYITTIAGLVCFSWSIYRTITFDRIDYLYNDSLTTIIERQSIYISLLVTLSIFIFAYHLFYKTISGTQKSLILLAAAFLFCFSYFLASRNMMIVLYLSTSVFLFYYIIQKKIYLEGATLVMGLLIAVFLVFKFFPQTLNRFKELTYTKFEYQHIGKESHFNVAVSEDQWNGANFRLAAWSCGWELFKRNPIRGVGLGDKRHELFRMYEEKKFHFALKEQKNVHSNYLDILYSMGTIGFLAFILAWVVWPLLTAWRYRDGLAFLVILTLSIAMITEIYFDRTIGGLVVGFFIPFVLSDKRKRQP